MVGILLYVYGDVLMKRNPIFLFLFYKKKKKKLEKKREEGFKRMGRRIKPYYVQEKLKENGRGKHDEHFVGETKGVAFCDCWTVHCLVG